MGSDVVDAKLGYPASEAVNLLLHHVHGGLHNAAMSLQLAGEDARTRGGDDARLVAQSGLEGIAQAARGVSLMTVLFGLKAGSGEAPADRQWVGLVESLLRQHATRKGVRVTIEPNLVAPGEGGVPDPDRMIAALLDGIEAIDAAGPDAHVHLPRSTAAASA
jgi:hypothetical protein